MNIDISTENFSHRIYTFVRSDGKFVARALWANRIISEKVGENCFETAQKAFQDMQETVYKIHPKQDTTKIIEFFK